MERILHAYPRKIVIATALSLFTFAFSHSALALQVIFEVGNPMVPAGAMFTDQFELFLDGQRIIISVFPLTSMSTRETKAAQLARAINDLRINNQQVLSATVGGVNPITGLRDVTITATNPNSKLSNPSVLNDNSREKSGAGTQISVPEETFQALGIIDFHGTPTGMDFFGSVSRFQSSLIASDTNVLANSDFLFNDLSIPQRNLLGILTNTFNNLHNTLPTDMQDNLRPDFANEQITFLFPANINVLAVNFSSDATTAPTAGVQLVSEPSILAIFSISLVITGYFWCRRKYV